MTFCVSLFFSVPYADIMLWYVYYYYYYYYYY